MKDEDQPQLLRRLRKGERLVRRAEELSEAEIAEIGQAEVPPGHEHLDDELG